MTTSNSKQNLSDAASGAPAQQSAINPSTGAMGGMNNANFNKSPKFAKCNAFLTGSGASGSASGPHLLSAANHLEIPSNNPNLLSPDILNQRRGK